MPSGTGATWNGQYKDARELGNMTGRPGLERTTGIPDTKIRPTETIDSDLHLDEEVLWNPGIMAI
jgi:hypothetical protein